MSVVKKILRGILKLPLLILDLPVFLLIKAITIIFKLIANYAEIFVFIGSAGMTIMGVVNLVTQKTDNSTFYGVMLIIVAVVIFMVFGVLADNILVALCTLCDILNPTAILRK